MVAALTELLSTALAFGFTTPMGLAAAGLLVPLVLLYMLRPDPSRLELPTMRFLHKELGRDDAVPAIKHVPRSMLLLLQALLILLFAVSIAAPYVPMAQETTASETVIVLDASASMQTQVDADGTTRFDRAVAAAQDAAAGDTTVMVAGAEQTVVLDEGSPAAARTALEEVTVDDTESDLDTAIAQGASMVSDSARVVVLSDFADGGDWRTSVQVARARGQTVELEQFAGGGSDNVGIVDLSFRSGHAVVTVRNYGTSEVTRELSLAGESTSVTLAPNDTARRALPVPTNGGELALSPGDSFPTDDTVTVSAPGTPSISVLLLTNEPNRELKTAFRVMDTVDATVKRPPTSVNASAYDVVIFGNVAYDRLLEGTVTGASEVLRSGGGVVVQGNPGVGEAGLGEMLLLAPNGSAENGTLSNDVSGGITADISFPDPRRYLTGELRSGEALVKTDDGAPIVARGTAEGGPVLYYGYQGNDSRFETNFMYPVFWKRVAFDLSGRPALGELNHATGDQLAVSGEVRLPSGETVQGPVQLTETGVYQVGDRRHAAALLDADESAVRAPTVGEGAGGEGSGADSRIVNMSLTPLLAALAGLLAVGELGFLYRRGDL